MFHYDFLKYRVPSAVLSVAIVLIGIVAYVVKGGFRYSVDFTGGTEFRVRFDQEEDTAAIKKAVHEQWKGTVYSILGSHELIVRVQESVNVVPDLDKKVLATVNDASPANAATLIQVNSISNSVGKTLWSKFLKAAVLSLLLMLLYITISFQFAFAVGAIVGVAHDALIVLTFFLVFDKEISVEVIGAILAVLAYSINDTIIIFSRIRQNLKKVKGQSLYNIVNMSLNQTLRRTILTSSATALVVLSQFILGGPTIRDLSFSLLLGIVFGAFSSIYIASPVMMLFSKDKN